MAEFKVGNRVVIKPGSRYYGISQNNPVMAIRGTITRINTHSYDLHPIAVNWDNNTQNFYHKTDLEFVNCTLLSISSLSYKRMRKIDKKDKAIIAEYLSKL